MEVKPQMHVFRHIHGGYGTVKIGPTTFANFAMWDGDGEAERRPFTITLQPAFAQGTSVAKGR
jgi:Icc-related predicted phosphoesterase